MADGWTPRQVRLSTRQAMTALIQSVRRRPAQAATLMLISMGAVGLLAIGDGYPPESYQRDLSVNFGAGLILTVLTYTLLDRLIRSVVESRTRELSRFDATYFLEAVNGCRSRVMILETWIGMMGGTAQFPGFFEAILHGLRRGIEVELYLLDPDSDAAKQRSVELNHRVNVPHEIMACLLNMQTFANRWEGARFLGRLRVYIGHQHPQIQVYSWDRRALITFYTREYRAYDRPQIETDLLGTPWGHFVAERREVLLGDPRTYKFEDYRTRAVTFSHEDGTKRETRVRFVAHDGTHYIQDSQVTRERDEARIRATVNVFEPDADTRVFGLAVVTGAELDIVLDLFRLKYDTENEVYFRLVSLPTTAVVVPGQRDFANGQ